MTSAAAQPPEISTVEGEGTTVVATPERTTPEATEEPQPGQPDKAAEAEKQPQSSTGFISSAFDFILNPNLEEADEDFSSSEEESD